MNMLRSAAIVFVGAVYPGLGLAAVILVGASAGKSSCGGFKPERGALCRRDLP